MATTTSLTSTYAGEAAGDYIIGAMAEIKTLDYITVKDNVPWNIVVRKLVDSVSFADQTCDFTPTGTVTLTERVLTLKALQVHRKLCKNDFGGTNQGGTAVGNWKNPAAGLPSLPENLADAMTTNILGQVAAGLETMIWDGTAGATAFDGFTALFDADGTVIDVTTPVQITASNVVAEIGRLISTSLASTKGKAIHGSAEKPVIYVSPKTSWLYQQAQAALGYNNLFNAQGDINLKYIGYDIKVCPGMPNSTMVLAQPSNLWFGTNRTDQMNRLNIIDQEMVDGSNGVNFVLQFYAGVQYGFGDEITLYHQTSES